jgi:hypothetical protein
MNTTTTASKAPGMKMYLGIVAAVLSYLLTQEVTDFPQIAELAINAVSVALAVYLGLPQPTVTTIRDVRDEAGYGLVELVVAVLLILILVFVLLRVM